MAMTSKQAGHYEYVAWRRVVDLLKETGAVTDADCAALEGDPPETPGEELFEAIRTWGVLYCGLRIHSDHHPEQE